MKQFLRAKPHVLLLAFISSTATAQELGGRISVSSGESDNAGKSDANQFSERQDTYEVGLSGEYTNQFLNATADYTGLDRRFAKDSQDDQRTLDGAAAVMLGALNDPIDLLLTHSRRTLLSAPDALNTTSNEDEREIIGATPRVKLNISSADMLMASVNFTNIHFLENDLNDSSRNTASLTWSRRSSPISNINLQIQQSEISFDNFEEADYRYINSVATYSVQLRKLAYAIAVGYNRSERDSGSSYGNPTYTISSTYEASLHSFSLMASRVITDSSMGNGNSLNSNTVPTNDGAFKVDQIERTSTELSYSTQIVCVKCTVGFSLNQNQDNYLLLPEDSQQEGGSFSFAYNFSNNLQFSYRFSDMKRTFSESLGERDYDYKAQDIDLAYKLTRNTSLRIFMEIEDRDSAANDRTYKEEFIGASLSVVF